MKTHKFQINALCVITIVVPWALLVVLGKASLVLAKGKDNNNNNNDDDTLVIAIAGDAPNGDIDNNTTQTNTETETTTAMPTQSCNKFNKNPRTKNGNENENEINAIIENAQRAVRGWDEKRQRESLISQSAASWSSVARNRSGGRGWAEGPINWPKGVEKNKKALQRKTEDESDNANLEMTRSEGDEGTPRSRAKRFLIFEDGGVVKFVVGVSFPVKLVDKMRSMSVFYNMQVQYTPPQTPIYWWSFWNSTSFAVRRTLEHDASRSFVYAALEQLLDSKGIPGAPCLLRAICAVAERPIGGNTVFHVLLNAIFTPAAANIEGRYLDAQAAGRGGADCAQTFSGCPKNIDWLAP